MSKPEVVFLCGGQGERMGPNYVDRQKCMQYFEGEPLLAYGLQAASAAFDGNFTPILAVGHKDEEVRNGFGDFWRGNRILYVPHTPGTEDKGALLSLREVLSGDPFLVVHGNIIFEGGLLRELMDIHTNNNPMATLALATKVEESMHDIARTDDPQGKRVLEIIVPRGPRTLQLLKEENMDIPTFEPDWPADAMRSGGWMRDMGAVAYSRNVPGHNVFNDLIDRYGPDRSPHMIWLYADYLKRGGELAGAIYDGDWLHFETPDDFQRVRGEASYRAIHQSVD